MQYVREYARAIRAGLSGGALKRLRSAASLTRTTRNGITMISLLAFALYRRADIKAVTTAVLDNSPVYSLLRATRCQSIQLNGKMRARRCTSVSWLRASSTSSQAHRDRNARYKASHYSRPCLLTSTLKNHVLYALKILAYSAKCTT